MANAYTLAELEELISGIKYTYNITEREIVKEAGYNEIYLSQTRSRKKVSDKFFQALVNKYPKAKGIMPPSSDDHSLLVVLMQRVARLLSGQPGGRSEMIELELMKKDAEELRKIRGG